MLKKTIKYTDFNDNAKSTVVYFNLTEPELVELTIDGSFEARIQRIVEARDVNSIIKEMKELIQLAYGEKTEDGESFIKTPALTAAFTQTAAYAALFMELAQDADAAAAFIEGIVPAYLRPHKDQDKPSFPPPRPASVGE